MMAKTKAERRVCPFCGSEDDSTELVLDLRWQAMDERKRRQEAEKRLKRVTDYAEWVLREWGRAADHEPILRRILEVANGE